MTQAAIASLALALAAAMLVAAALSDLARMRIPNALVAALGGIYLFALPVASLTVAQIGTAALSAAAILAAGMVLFAAGVMGGGDVKLAAAAALWLGPGLIAEFLLLTALLGGALALGVAVLRRAPRLAAAGWPPCLSADAGVPYGIALAGAALWLLPASPMAGPG